MKFPGPLADSLPLIDLLKQILNYLRASRTLSINGVPGRETPNGTSFVIPVGGAGAGGGGGAAYTPWKPNFFTTGADSTLVYKCRFNLGTINGVSASNWDTEFVLPSGGEVRFVMLSISTAEGKVNGVEIQLTATAPIADYVLIDTPPPSWKILLGAIDKSNGQMIVATNRNAIAVEVYRASKAVVAVGGEPFSRYWRWNHSAS